MAITPGIVLSNRFSFIRLYDGTSGGTPPGPFYYDLPFVVANLRAPFGRPRPAQVLKTNRGILDNLSHKIITIDDAVAEGQPITFDIELLDTEYDNVIAALSNPFRISPWTVGNQTWTNTNATTQIRNGAGTLVTAPDTDDVVEDRVNLEIRMQARKAGATDLVIKWKELFFPPNQDFSINVEGNRLTVNAMWYGAIEKAATFTTGTDTTA